MTIAEFLIQLAEDPDALASYREDPTTYIQNSDLTEAQKGVLLSDDTARIQHVVEYELAELGMDSAFVAGPGPLGFVLCRVEGLSGEGPQP